MKIDGWEWASCTQKAAQVLLLEQANSHLSSLPVWRMLFITPAATPHPGPGAQPWPFLPLPPGNRLQTEVHMAVPRGWGPSGLAWFCIICLVPSEYVCTCPIFWLEIMGTVANLPSCQIHSPVSRLSASTPQKRCLSLSGKMI